MLSVMKRNKTFLYLVFFALVLFTFFFVRTDRSFDYRIHEEEPVISSTVIPASGEEIRQVLNAGNVTLYEIMIRFGTANENSKGTLKVKLLCNDKTVKSWECDLSSIKANRYRGFFLDKELTLEEANA